MCKTDWFGMHNYVIALITNLFSQFLFYHNVQLLIMCSESLLEAAWSRGRENTIITGNMIDKILV